MKMDNTTKSTKSENNEIDLDIALIKVDTIGSNTADMLTENGAARKLFIETSKENKQSVMDYIFSGDPDAENPLAHITGEQTKRENGYTEKIKYLVMRVKAQRSANSKIINK